MKWKIIWAYLKALSKYRRMVLFFLKYLFSFSRYRRFSIMQIWSVMTSYCLQLKSGKYWINDISGNIEAVFLKLGTINVHHKKNQNDTLSVVSIATLLAPISFCQKTKKSPFATSTVGQRVLLGTEIVPILSLVPSLDWVG